MAGQRVATERIDLDLCRLAGEHRTGLRLLEVRDDVEAARDQALAEREVARLNLGYTEVRAPIDGVVGNRSARTGSYATPGVSLIALVPFVLVTNPSFPARDLKEFIANVRANPGKYSFSSSGTAASAYMVTALFNSMAQLDAQHVPYKGSGPAIADIIGGQITYTIETVAATVGHVKSGRLKAYGVSFSQRANAMPDVPTIAEAAPLPGYDIGAWIGYTAPAGTPREAVARLAAEMQKIAQAPEIKERYLSLGLDPISSTPDEMATFLRQQQERYGAIIKAQGIKIE